MEKQYKDFITKTNHALDEGLIIRELDGKIVKSIKKDYPNVSMESLISQESLMQYRLGLINQMLSKDRRTNAHMKKSLAAITKDLDASGEDLEVEGTFKNKGGEVARKLALYTQDGDKKVTQRFTLTVDTLKVDSPQFYNSNGTVKGNIIVNKEGFHGQTGKGVEGQATIEGDLTFKNQALLETYQKLLNDKKVKVTGEIKVK